MIRGTYFTPSACFHAEGQSYRNIHIEAELGEYQVIDEASCSVSLQHIDRLSLAQYARLSRVSGLHRFTQQSRDEISVLSRLEDEGQ